jgi:phosphate transport system substrate-binding protein
VQVPVDLGAVVVAYNVITSGNGPLRLIGPVIARIFLGQITKLDDPAIQALNPGTELPDAYINIVHRSDGSGTTYIFSNYPSSVSPAWAAAVGTGRSLRWPVGIGADGNAGVAAQIGRIPYSIGSTERSFVTGTTVGSAAIQNRSGNYVLPTTAAITADAAGRPDITPTGFSIVNEPGPASYPVCGYSWVLLSARQPSQAEGKALTALIGWLTHAGQAYAAALGYVPLPPAIGHLAAATLARVTGPAGQSLAS